MNVARLHKTTAAAGRVLFTIWCMCLLLFLKTSGLQAQSSLKDGDPDSLNMSKELTITQAIQIAQANNTSIKRAVLSIKDADQEIRSAWSNVMPEVSSSASYTRNLEVPVNFIPAQMFDPDADPDELMPVAFGTDNNWQAGLSVSQTIFNGQAFVGINSSELYKAAQSENLRATAQEIVTQTRNTFYNVLLAKEQLRLQQNQVERIQANLKDTRSRHKQGFVDSYAVIELEVQLNNLKPQLTDARFAVEDARRNLLKVMGLPVNLSIEVKGDLNAFDIHSETATAAENHVLKQVDRMTPLTLETDSLMLAQALNYRGDLRMLDIQQRLQEKDIKAQKSQYLPTISASYNYQWTASQSGTPNFFGTANERARSQTLMLNVQVPIFQGFSRDASVQQAKIELKDLQYQEYAAQQEGQQEIISAKQDIRNAFETATARKRALEQAQVGYERALTRYQNGLGTQQEVTDAEFQLREAELNYAQMVFNYLSAKAQYDQAIGQVPFVEKNPSEIIQQVQIN